MSPENRLLSKKSRFSSRFSLAAEHQAKCLSIPEEVFCGRKEVRGLSIDSPNPDEIDDCVWFERDGNDTRVSIHIPHFSELIEPGSPIDIEASLRSFSKYFPDKTYTMLPKTAIEKIELKKELKIQH